jgi:hypothetical protein
MGPRLTSREQPEPSPASHAAVPSLAAAIEGHLDLRRRQAALGKPPDTDPRTVAPPSDQGNPPRFLFGEIVRLAQASGTETDERGGAFDAGPLVEKEFAVLGASPSDDREGWRIHLRADRIGTVIEVPESALEPTGWIEVVDATGGCDQVPIDPSRHRGWRDDLMLEIASPVRSRATATALAEEIATVVRGLVTSDAVEWQIDEPGAVPYPITLWVWPAGDALTAFDQLVQSVGGGWHHDEDESLFISSRWERGGGDRVFLSPAVRSAELTYRCWTTPRPRAQRERAANPGDISLTRASSDSAPSG